MFNNQGEDAGGVEPHLIEHRAVVIFSNRPQQSEDDRVEDGRAHAGGVGSEDLNQHGDIDDKRTVF